IGVGGGRDILSSLVFKDRSVVGVEVNPGMLYLVQQKYADYTGHLDRYPSVRLVNDEARSYVTRSGAKFGIIQASLIDTFAATAAGAFAQTENALYTVDGWKIFMDHLTDNGLITFTRPYTPKSPNETYRLLSLAGETLRQLKVSEPRAHIILVGNHRSGYAQGPGCAATILVAKSPFTDADLDKADEVAARLGYEVILSKRVSRDPVFTALTAAQRPNEFFRTYNVNLAPPTDDCPFFFNFLGVRHLLASQVWTNQGYSQLTSQGLGALTVPLLVMFNLIVITTSLTLLCIVLPLWLKGRRTSLSAALPLISYFSAIGLAFMFVEVSQMQVLTVFLGNPTYGLTVVLFTLLLSGGIGSYATNSIKPEQMRKQCAIRLGLLIVMLMLLGVGLHPITSYFVASTGPVRVLLCVALLSIPGFFMGMAFPMGMRLAQSRAPESTPWLWGINGSTSVCASVFAAFLALNWGIHISFWTGVACYLLALVAFIVASKSAVQSE
ncbi:MAG: hypothetical protein ACRD3W_18420, partial [Terriglobales bacterium]